MNKTSQSHDVVQGWLSAVAFAHSKSPRTAASYRLNLKRFCDYADTTPEGIIKEYESADDRKFKMKYAQLLQDWIGSMSGTFAQQSIITRLGTIRSFFKYRSLPLAFVPQGRAKITYHNRAISKDEIKTLINEARGPREKAYYVLMVQSGLRPGTIDKLRLKDLEPDWTKMITPCRILVPEEEAKGQYKPILTFIGEDSIYYLRNYFTTRSPVTKESYLFVSKKGEPIERTLTSHLFQDTMRRLRQKGIISYETKTKGKPSELRLYALRKYFRQQAGNAGDNYVNYWMGHALSGVDAHYFPGRGTDITEDVVEHHRQRYKDLALPYLQLEAPTPIESNLIVQKQAQEIKRLNEEMQKLQLASLSDDEWQELKMLLAKMKAGKVTISE